MPSEEVVNKPPHADRMLGSLTVAEFIEVIQWLTPGPVVVKVSDIGRVRALTSMIGGGLTPAAEK